MKTLFTTLLIASSLTFGVGCAHKKKCCSAKSCEMKKKDCKKEKKDCGKSCDMKAKKKS